MKKQQRLFEKIEKTHFSKWNLVHVVKDLLDISLDSAYKRIQGNTELTFSEALKLSEHFKISLDSIAATQSEDVLFKYIPLELQGENDYYANIKCLRSIFEDAAKAKEKEIIFAAANVPFVHFMPFLELSLFKAYTWFQSAGKFITYEQFVEILDVSGITKLYSEIDKAYQQIPSTEIWTNHTLDQILFYFEHCYETRCFEKKESANRIASQLLQLIKRIKQYAKEGKKDGADFQIYLSPMNVMSDLMLAKYDDSMLTSIKLYKLEKIFTSNQAFCSNVEQWMKDIIKRSHCLSESAEKERFGFFEAMKDKVNLLIEQHNLDVEGN